LVLVEGLQELRVVVRGHPLPAATAAEAPGGTGGAGRARGVPLLPGEDPRDGSDQREQQHEDRPERLGHVTDVLVLRADAVDERVHAQCQWHEEHQHPQHGALSRENGGRYRARVTARGYLTAWLTTIFAPCSGRWSARATSSASRPRSTRIWRSVRSSTG